MYLKHVPNIDCFSREKSLPFECLESGVEGVQSQDLPIMRQALHRLSGHDKHITHNATYDISTCTCRIVHMDHPSER